MLLDSIFDAYVENVVNNYVQIVFNVCKMSFFLGFYNIWAYKKGLKTSQIIKTLLKYTISHIVLPFLCIWRDGHGLIVLKVCLMCSKAHFRCFWPIFLKQFYHIWACKKGLGKSQMHENWLNMPYNVAK